MRASSLFFACVVLLLVFAPVVSASAPVLGDVNRDGYVNSTDALVVMSFADGVAVPPQYSMGCGDVNADGLVNYSDAGLILAYDAGLSVDYPIGTDGCEHLRVK